MKKNLVLLTGIVFVLTILLAGGCGQKTSAELASADSDSADSDSAVSVESIVNIDCKADTTGGILQFIMWDSDDTVVATPSPDDPLKFIADDTTIVHRKDLVFWGWDRDSHIDRFVKIGPPVFDSIINANAIPINSSWNILLYRIPRDAPLDRSAPYYIKFLWGEDTVTIDPHLKVPDQQ